MRQRLGYLHLPKAAGTSIRAAVSSYYSQQDTVPWLFDRHLFGDHPGLREVSDERVFLGSPLELQSYAYMEGHWAIPTMLTAFAPSEIVCILREPRSRFLSHYAYWRGWPPEAHALWEPYRGALFAQLPLREYCLSAPIAHQADNLMTRLILGPHRLAPNDGHIRHSDIDTVAAEAIRIVGDLGYVDVLERGEAMHRDFEEWFGSPLPRERLNVTDLEQGKPIDLDDLIDQRTLRLVNDRNASDLRVWEHVAAQRMNTALGVRSISDSAYGSAIGRIVLTHTRVRAQPEIEHLTPPKGGPTPAPLSTRSSAFVRLVRLFFRGPRIWRDRIRDEVEYRRGTPDTDVSV